MISLYYGNGFPWGLFRLQVRPYSKPHKRKNVHCLPDRKRKRLGMEMQNTHKSSDSFTIPFIPTTTLIERTHTHLMKTKEDGTEEPFGSHVHCRIEGLSNLFGRRMTALTNWELVWSRYRAPK